MRRAWHGWCVACIVVALPGTHRCGVCTGHAYVGVVVVPWSGGCGPWRAANSRGTEPNFFVLVVLVLALLWRCFFWNDYAFKS